ncbi:MAG TPA: hypothetical protein VHR45_20685 [Thermoanaerobaculia bacterium]|nr:hypothetical protein [Thermoanaerobaculia bacterium]
MVRRQRGRAWARGALAVAAGLAGAALWGCGKSVPATPLLDGRHGAEVLVENGRLALPPASAAANGGNRFGEGWQLRQERGEPLAAPAAPFARLEVVHLGEEVQRTLTLALAPGELPPGSRVRVRTGERDLARLPLAGTPALRVRLPDDFPIGRVPVDFWFEPWQRGTPAVAGAMIEPVLPAGAVRIAGADVLQSGNSLVYLGRALGGSETLVGTFVPPAAPRPGQRFELTAERADGTPIRRFYWSPSFWNLLRGERRVELPLRGVQGRLRVRLLARGEGPPARWRALRLIHTDPRELSPGV